MQPKLSDMENTRLLGIRDFLAKRREFGLPAGGDTEQSLGRQYLRRPVNRPFLPSDPTGNASDPMDIEGRRRAAMAMTGARAQPAQEQRKELFRDDRGGIEDMLRRIAEFTKTNRY